MKKSKIERINRIHYFINKILNEYLEKGVKLEDLNEWLNNDEENYKQIYNTVYRKLTVNNVNFESSELKESLRDNIVDKINLMKDIG